MRLPIFCILLILLSAQTCEKPIEQGVIGHISWLEGNQMPGINDPESREPAQPVVRTLRFYNVTQLSQVEANGQFYQEPSTELVGTITSNEEGYYGISLEPGVYSVFVEEEEGLWANSFDGNGRINPIQVWEDSLSQKDIVINYKAAY